MFDTVRNAAATAAIASAPILRSVASAAAKQAATSAATLVLTVVATSLAEATARGLVGAMERRRAAKASARVDAAIHEVKAAVTGLETMFDTQAAKPDIHGTAPAAAPAPELFPLGGHPIHPQTGAHLEPRAA